MSVTEKASKASCFPYKSLDEEEACVGVKIAEAQGNHLMLLSLLSFSFLINTAA